jgi:hypothetical protein
MSHWDELFEFSTGHEPRTVGAKQQAKVCIERLFGNFLLSNGRGLEAKSI